MGKEFEVYRDRAAAELDKDLAASSKTVRPISGYVFREGKKMGVHIYDMSRFGGEIAVHLTETPDSEGLVTSRSTVENSAEVLKMFPDLKFEIRPQPFSVKRFERSIA